MEPNFLNINEIQFELKCRGINPGDNQIIRRSQLRQALKKSDIIPNIQPCSWEENISQISDSINDINDFFHIKENSRLKKIDILRLETRISHLNNRMNLLNEDNDPDKCDIKEQLFSEIGILYELMNEIVEDQNKSVMSTPGHVSLNQNVCASKNNIVSVNDINNYSRRPAVPVHKWKIDRFIGHESKESVTGFIERINDLRLARGISEHELFESAHDLFDEKATQWFRNVREEMNTWDELVVELKKEFLPTDYNTKLLDEIRERTQGISENVCSYMIALESLMKRAIEKPTEKEITDRIIKNLNPYFAERVEVDENTSLKDLKAKCRSIQDRKLRVESYKPPPSKRSGLVEPDMAFSSTKPTIVNAFEENTTQLRYKKCKNCLQFGHYDTNCPQQRQIFCYGCGKPNTFKSHCTNCNPQHNPSPSPLISKNSKNFNRVVSVQDANNQDNSSRPLVTGIQSLSFRNSVFPGRGRGGYNRGRSHVGQFPNPTNASKPPTQ